MTILTTDKQFYTEFQPGAVWCDTDGSPIQAHGGGVMCHQGVYYWYGENKDVPNMPGEERVEVVGVSCYSSGRPDGSRTRPNMPWPIACSASGRPAATPAPARMPS